MKICANELNGVALDWAVAMSQGLTDKTLKIGYMTALEVIIDEYGELYDMRYGRQYSPSTNWSQGGPIIEREEIATHRWECEEHRNPEIRWRAELPRKGIFAKGPTPLVAAMRCYVASKLGEDIEVPYEFKS